MFCLRILSCEGVRVFAERFLHFSLKWQRRNSVLNVPTAPMARKSWMGDRFAAEAHSQNAFKLCMCSVACS